MQEEIELINRRIEESVALKQNLGDDLKQNIRKAADAILQAHNNQKRIWIIGNGGSAADAQHFACELVGRFLKDRQPIDATALTTNTSSLTALANDFAAEMIFVRQVKAHVREGDIFIPISTSGKSPNIVNAAREAHQIGATVVGLTGADGGRLADVCHLLLNVPSDSTPRIQESHILLIHVICELVENAVSGQ